MSKKAPKNIPNAKSFLVQNLIKGLLWFAVIILAFIIAKKYFHFSMEAILGPIYDQPVTVYLIFLASEVIFGIIPPEFFMIWALKSGQLENYIENVVLLSVISYTSGVLGYWIGLYLNRTKLYQFVKKRVFGKFYPYLKKYGGFLVVIAALTPVPFSGIAMLVGSVKYPFDRYLAFSVARFVRFLVYAIVVWQANAL